MAIASRIELETASNTWTSLDKWAVAFESFSGRKRGLGPHRAGSSTLTLRVPQGESGFPSSLGDVSLPATAQGDRIRVYIKPGTATERLIWVGWVTDVRWSASELLFFCEVTSTDALGRLGPLEIDYPFRDSELAGNRLRALLTKADWTFGSDLDQGSTLMANTLHSDVRTGSAVKFCQDVALSDPGVLCAHPSLTAPLRFLGRGYTPARTLVISDQQFTAGVRWQQRARIEAAEDHLVNVVRWTEVEDDDEHSNQDNDSVTAYGERRIDRDFEFTSGEALTVTTRILRTYKSPVSIPREARVALHVEPDARASAAATTVIGDLAICIVTGFDGRVSAQQTLVDGVGWRLVPRWQQGVAVHQTLNLIPVLGASVDLPVSLPPLPTLVAPGGQAWSISLPSAYGGSGNGFNYTMSNLPSWLTFAPISRPTVRNCTLVSNRQISDICSYRQERCHIQSNCPF